MPIIQCNKTDLFNILRICEPHFSSLRIHVHSMHTFACIRTHACVIYSYSAWFCFNKYKNIEFTKYTIIIFFSKNVSIIFRNIIKERMFVMLQIRAISYFNFLQFKVKFKILKWHFKLKFYFPTAGLEGNSSILW